MTILKYLGQSKSTFMYDIQKGESALICNGSIWRNRMVKEIKFIYRFLKVQIIQKHLAERKKLEIFLLFYSTFSVIFIEFNNKNVRAIIHLNIRQKCNIVYYLLKEK